MNENDVRDMARSFIYNNTVLNGKVEETHISWVILTRAYAIKIKKPIQLDFLDFSTLELRKQLCEKEIRLNSRFSDIYLAVVPIRFVDNRWVIGGQGDSDIVEYGVLMRRMAVSKRLDNVLLRGSATKKSIRALAIEVAHFHTRAEKKFNPFNIESARNTFNDIHAISAFAVKNIDPCFGDIIEYAVEWSDTFLTDESARIQTRIDHGLQRDIHGDLHCRNIFLYRKPILFDCIEFNDQYRQIDVLYEIAFLCMDLERFGYPRLSESFLNEYSKHFPAFQTRDRKLFTYYKSLRANIRAKVHAWQWQQAETESEVSFHLSETRRYLSLMNEYIAEDHALAYVSDLQQ